MHVTSIILCIVIQNAISMLAIAIFVVFSSYSDMYGKYFVSLHMYTTIDSLGTVIIE